jgi:4-amino-4-deoxy-L-arabinose transferase-like glycosyltransferase
MKTGVLEFATRHFAALACVLFALAAFNLTFRLSQEFLTEWDESLYATTAAEALDDGHWIATTFNGDLDYYNTKPPLNVWLIALAFAALGKSLVSLRLASVISAWLTVVVLTLWTTRARGAPTGLLAGAILATTFGFIHIHSGRSGNTDALFTLIIVLTGVVLWAERSRPWLRAWLGLLLAATFLLRGMAVLMPLGIVALTWVAERDWRRAWGPTLAALALLVVPVGAWMIARYRVDGWEFLSRLFFYDFVARTATVIEDHPGGPFYYLNILQKHQFDWLGAAAVAFMVAPIPWGAMRAWIGRWRHETFAMVLVVWAFVVLAEPTVMRTKLPWYLNPFYPVFAVVVAALVVRAAAVVTGRGWRAVTLAGTLVVAFGLAESKLIWYSFKYRDLALSDQGLMLAERSQLSGHRLYRALDDRAGTFVILDVVGADPRYAPDATAFLEQSAPGDFFLGPAVVSHPGLELVRSNGHFWLYRRASRP